MLISLNWLKDFINIPKKITPEKLGELLTMHTVEVDDIINESEKFDNVVVGKILEVNRHPNADRLQLAIVDIGGKIKEIVCGAPNIAKGQLVPVALVGAILPNGMEIKAAEIRGVKSEGMLCAVDELGLGDDHSGIMILSEKAKIGQSFGGYMNIDDVIFEIDNKSMTHRPDLWSHYGIARDLGAVLDINIKSEIRNSTAPACCAAVGREFETKLKNSNLKQGNINIKVEDKVLCPRYMAAVISGIEIKESPEWIAKRLISCGMRPINNIVDITNYVLLELGQPTHAFDASQVKEIIVRRAKKEEPITTLDNEKRELDNSMLVIADAQKPIAIAGIMGGENSEINNKTNAIILESANFDHVSIRKTSAKLGLRTESSIRFEKGLDPNLCAEAINRIMELIKESCPKAKVEGGIIDIKNFKLNQGPIELDLNWLNDFIGKNIPKKRSVEILTRLGFGVKEKSKNILSAAIPSWRATKDVSIPQDLAEEIARIEGYETISAVMPLVGMAPPEIDEERALIRKIKNYLVGAPALTEVGNYSFVGEDLLKKLGINSADYLRLANPLSNIHALLRQHLAPNLILDIKTNQAQFEEIKIFEIGSVYLPFDGSFKKDDKNNTFLPYQEKRLGIAIGGIERSASFAEIKGVMAYLGECLNLKFEFAKAAETPNWADPSYSAKIKTNDIDLGYINCLDSAFKQKLGIKKEVFIAEIGINKLQEAVKSAPSLEYRENEKFPPVVRDIAFVIDEEICYNDIKSEMNNFHPYIKSVELFDVYAGEKLGKGKKNMAFHVIYQADQTLTGAEVDQIQNKLTNHLEKTLGAAVRNF